MSWFCQGAGNPVAGGVVPACVIVKAWPATVTVPVRVVELLAATVMTTVPLPVPLVVLRETQDRLSAAVHAQALVVVTVTCVPPPPAGTEAAVADSV